MIERSSITGIAREYGNKVTVGVIGSHSALDVLDGASQEGLPSITVTQKGRDASYTRYFRKVDSGGTTRGVVDGVMRLDKFSDIMKPGNRRSLRERNTVFVPNRSFSSYCTLGEIEDVFDVPIFGSRALLRSEEREEKDNYYTLLEKGGLPYPQQIKDPSDIDSLVIVKLHHKVKKLERGFFTAASFEEYTNKARELVRSNVISEVDLSAARIERYIIGPVFNLDFFYSPLQEKGEKIELLGIDWRFESSLDGHVRLPAEQQLSLSGEQRIPEYTVVGHNSATLRESLLDGAFQLAEKYVDVAGKTHPPGIIGPFTLQTCVDKDMHFYIYDVAPRIGGGTNVHAWVGHSYGNMLYNCNMSTGRRIALELGRGAKEERLQELVT